MRRSLIGKLFIAFLGVLIVFAASLFAGFVAFSRFALGASDQILHRSVAEALAQQIRPALTAGSDHRLLHAAVRSFSAANPRINIFFVSREGAVLADYASEPGPRRSGINPGPIARFLESREMNDYPIMGDNPLGAERPVVFSAAPIRIGATDGYVYLTLDSHSERALWTVLRENSAAGWAVFALVLSLCLAGAGGYGMLRLLTRRFRKMTERVSVYAKGDFSERLPAGSGSDEVELLSSTINSMADSISSQLSELERRDQLRRELVSNVAHDLRSPLVLISGYVQRLEHAGCIDPGSEESEFIRGISRNAGALETLLSDLFDLSRLESAELLPVPELFSITELLDDLALDYSASARAKGVTLSVSAPDDLPSVSADRAMLQRVFTNLIDNALRYTPSGGTIVLRGTKLPHALLLEVEDSGSGIEQQHLSKVFERFHQVDDGSKKGMSGLGLAIVKRIIEAHHSKIELSSTLGAGTRFYFKLPLTAALQAERAA